jgi:hypothetical protein
MKQPTLPKLLLVALFALAFTAATLKADTLAQWTFESSFTSITGTSASLSGLTPELLYTGASAAASGTHAGATTVWSSPVGDGSLHSFSANLWAQSDFFQFTITPDQVNYSYSAINIAYDQNGSGTGPRTFYFAYSTDGSTWNTVGSDYQLTSGVTWSSSIAGQPTHEAFDLSAITALNTAGTMYFRIVDDSLVTGGAINGGNVGTGGTDRIDNFTITANVTLIPEPATATLLGLFGGLLAWNVIRRRR